MFILYSVSNIFGVLDIKDSNGVFSYKVNTKIKDQVKSVKSTLAIANEKKSTIVNEEAHYLYMGSKSDCKYDSTEGTVECTPDFKWLLLNGKQPMAMYPYENDENKILSPVYLPEKDAVEYIVILKNATLFLKIFLFFTFTLIILL